MNMARERMSRAVEPPPEYFDPTDGAQYFLVARWLLF